MTVSSGIFAFLVWGWQLVAVRPGDLLLFDPLEPHCVSSWCKNDHVVVSVSVCLKTAVVGLNDNTISLTATVHEALS